MENKLDEKLLKNVEKVILIFGSREDKEKLKKIKEG